MKNKRAIPSKNQAALEKMMDKSESEIAKSAIKSWNRVREKAIRDGLKVAVVSKKNWVILTDGHGNSEEIAKIESRVKITKPLKGEVHWIQSPE